MPDAIAARRTLVRRAFLLRSEGLGRSVVRGAGFQFLGIALRTIITIGSMAVLARLLSPADFGYVAMATVVTEFAALFGNFGFNNLLVQRKSINRLHLDTVFWASLGLGFVLGAAVFVASFVAGWAFGDSRIGELLRVLCLAFFISGLHAVPWAILQRLMRFRTEFTIQIACQALRALAAVLAALAGWGVWSLVVGALVGAAINAAAYFFAVPYWPRLRFHAPLLIRTWKTSTSYFGGGLLFYINMNVDLMLIGRTLGAAPLGYYQNARSLTDEIRARIAIPIQHVLFPAFSALQADPDRFRSLVLQAGRLLAALVVPIGIGVSVNARELVLVVYGEKWLSMVPLMAAFGFGAALRAASAIVSPLFNATDNVTLSLKYNVLGTVMGVAAIVVALPYGIDAVALVGVVLSPYSLIVMHAGFKLIGLGARSLWHVLGPPSAGSAVMALVTLLIRPTVTETLGAPALVLAVDVIVGAAVYLITVALLAPHLRSDTRTVIEKLRR